MYIILKKRKDRYIFLFYDINKCIYNIYILFIIYLNYIHHGHAKNPICRSEIIPQNTCIHEAHHEATNRYGLRDCIFL